MFTSDIQETTSWAWGGPARLHQIPSCSVVHSPPSWRAGVPRNHLQWHLLWRGASTLQGLPTCPDGDPTLAGKFPVYTIWRWSSLLNSNQEIGTCWCTMRHLSYWWFNQQTWQLVWVTGSPDCGSKRWDHYYSNVFRPTMALTSRYFHRSNFSPTEMDRLDTWQTQCHFGQRL